MQKYIMKTKHVVILIETFSNFLKRSLNYLQVILSHYKTNSNSFFSNRNKSQDFIGRQTDTDYSKSTGKHFFVSCYPDCKIGNNY